MDVISRVHLSYNIYGCKQIFILKMNYNPFKDLYYNPFFVCSRYYKDSESLRDVMIRPVLDA